jgi:hypothetical protein
MFERRMNSTDCVDLLEGCERGSGKESIGGFIE